MSRVSVSRAGRSGNSKVAGCVWRRPVCGCVLNSPLHESHADDGARNALWTIHVDAVVHQMEFLNPRTDSRYRLRLTFRFLRNWKQPHLKNQFKMERRPKHNINMLMSRSTETKIVLEIRTYNCMNMYTVKPLYIDWHGGADFKWSI